MHSICQMHGYRISGHYIRNNFQSRCWSNRNACMCFIHAPCCWRIFTCAPSEFIVSAYPFITRSPACSLGHECCSTKQPASHAAAAHNSNTPTWVTSKLKWKVKSIPQKWLFSPFFVLSATLNLLHKCGQDIHNRAVPRLGFLWWDKRKPRRLSPAQLTFQVRRWCWLQPANWRHIWEMSSYVPNGLSLIWQSWCKRDLQWPGQPWRTVWNMMWSIRFSCLDFHRRAVNLKCVRKFIDILLEFDIWTVKCSMWELNPTCLMLHKLN